MQKVFLLLHKAAFKKQRLHSLRTGAQVQSEPKPKIHYSSALYFSCLGSEFFLIYLFTVWMTSFH